MMLECQKILTGFFGLRFLSLPGAFARSLSSVPDFVVETGEHSQITRINFSNW